MSFARQTGTVHIQDILAPTPGRFEAQSRDLAELSSAGRLRRLIPRAGRDFSSNDYLGLAGSPELAAAAAIAINHGIPVGSGGSRLLRGNHDEHEQLEVEAAIFFGAETALYFSSGYAANSALLATLPQAGDMVIHDALIHASAHEGLRLSRAEHVSARHNDAGHVEELAAAWQRNWSKGRLWLAVESLYSMDGDRAPLDALAAVADRYDAVLLIDEAHATGVHGPRGRGLASAYQGRDNVITLHTCGKALGCDGAFVCGPAIVRDALVNRARAFIFSTAPSPLMAALVRASLNLIAEADDRRRQLWRRIALIQSMCSTLGIPHGTSQIVPIVIGPDEETMEIAGRLQAAGFDVRGIRPPTVPAGTARLRISVTLNVNEQDIQALGFALHGLGRWSS